MKAAYDDYRQLETAIHPLYEHRVALFYDQAESESKYTRRRVLYSAQRLDIHSPRVNTRRFPSSQKSKTLCYLNGVRLAPHAAATSAQARGAVRVQRPLGFRRRRIGSQLDFSMMQRLHS